MKAASSRTNVAAGNLSALAAAIASLLGLSAPVVMAAVPHDPGVLVGAVDSTPAKVPTPAAVRRASLLASNIGAYEVQKNDIVFDAAFDGCPALPAGP